MTPGARLDFGFATDRAPRPGPGGARVLVFLVVNVEEWDIGRPMPRQVLPAPTDAAVLPDLANWAWHEYGMRAGFPRILAACDARGIRPTLSINGRVCLAYPRVAEAAHRRGWEFMGHGFRQVPTHALHDQEASVREAVAAIRAATGEAPVGWLSPGLTETPETPDILAAHGIRYCADFVVDDVPVPLRTAHGPIWTMPYSLELNDIPIFAVQHHAAAELPARTGAQLDRLLLESDAGGCKVMGLAVHPYLSGVPHRIGAFEAALDAVLRRPGARFLQGREILRWWEGAA